MTSVYTLLLVYWILSLIYIYIDRLLCHRVGTVDTTARDGDALHKNLESASSFAAINRHRAHILHSEPIRSLFFSLVCLFVSFTFQEGELGAGG